MTLPKAQERALLWLVVAAVCWRWLLAMRTPVPAEDGVNYLWMAQRFAAGDAAAALSEPFSPLWSLLLSLPIAAGVEPFLAGKVLGCVCGGLALWPVAMVAERLRAGAGLPAAALLATSSVLARTAPEVLTEPLFVLVAAFALWAGVAGRMVWLGALGGATFLVRPEGALVVLPFVLLQPRRAWPAGPVLLAVVAAFGAWRWLCGHGFDPVPKLAFHGLRSDLGDERGDLLRNLVQLPPVYMEAFLGAGLLAVLSLWPRRGQGRAIDFDATFGSPGQEVKPQGALRPARGRGERELWLLLLLGAAVIATFVPRRRFFVSWAPAVLPLAGVAVARMAFLRDRGRELLLVLLCGIDLWTGWHGTIAEDRIGERRVGEHLSRRLAPGQTVVSDMTRVLWFAEQRPLPPRHFDAAWYVAQALQPGVEFVVLHEESRRGVFADVARGIRERFARYDVPVGLRDAAAARGIAVFVRR